MTIVGLHDFVKVSISALLKSLLLIMCIDAPESTTNSRSSGFNVDAGRHLFSGDGKNAALSCSFNVSTLLASFHTASRAPCSCHSFSSCERSSNFGALGPRSWGSFTWINVTERGILVSNFGMTCNCLREFHTLDWSRHTSAASCPEIRNPLVVHQKTDVQMNFVPTSYHFCSQVAPFDCDKHLRRILFLAISLFQQSHSTFVIIRFRPFRRLFINLTVFEWALHPNPTNTLGLVVTAFWRVPFSNNELLQVPLK